MALLDRFRTARPLWEDPDPAVRAEGVRSLRAQDGDLLATILKSDPEAAVRKAALRRIEDVALLKEVAASDASLREQAQEILLRLASEGADPARALVAAEALADPRQLATLARAARLFEVREWAVERIDDARALAVIAKSAPEPKLRLRALARVSDEAARADVALKSEHKDVALLALEGVNDDAQLREIAQHAKSKAAARRAQSLLESQQEAPALAPPKPPEPEPDEAPEARALREAREHALDSRRVLIERVTALPPDHDPAALAEAEAAFARVPPLEDPLARELQRSFDAALAVHRERRERDERQQAESARAASEAQEKHKAAREKAEQQQKQQQERARIQELVARAQTLARDEAPALKDVERAMRELRTALQEEKDPLHEKLKQARAALYPRLMELRDADEWKRWANTQVQEELVARMESLRVAPDLDRVAGELHELSDRWRQFSQARKQDAEALWQRFRTAREAVQTRVGEHLRQKAQQEQANLAKKLALCEQAEALTASTDWIKTAERIQALQAEWKTVGQVPRKEQKRVWQRFHAACDRFFTARKQDLHRRKEEWSKNLEKKQALIERAEALAQRSDWDAAAAEIKNLQAEWKASGSVRKSKADALWERFKAAGDAFFERYKERDQIAAQANAALREGLLGEFEALASAEPAADAELAPKIQELLERWRQAPALSGTKAAELEERFVLARDGLIEKRPEAFRGGDLDPEANRTKRAKLLARVEALAETQGGKSADAGASLAERLKEALATNAMGGRAALEARWRETARELEQAQGAWKRIGPVPGEAGRELQRRFKKACDAVASKKPR